MKAHHPLTIALVGILTGLASAATLRKADDSVVNGDITGLQDGKVLVAKSAAPVSLEDIAIITLREKPRPVEPNPSDDPPPLDPSSVGRLMKIFFGGGNARPARPAQTTKRADPTPKTPPTTGPASTRPTRPAGSWQVKLQGEDCWTGSVKSWSEKKLAFQPDASPDVVVDVPVDRLREIWKGTPSLVAQARALKIQPGVEDVAFIEKDNQVHEVNGLVVGIEGDSLIFRFNEADRKIALSRLVGILFAGTQVAKEQAFHQAVELMSGDVISGQWKTLSAGNVGIETAWGKTMNIPLDTIANIQCRNGKLVYLSDLAPAHVEQVPYFDRVFPYRNDSSLNGGALKLLDGYYDKGIAVHSRSLLEYDVGGKFEQFKAHVGFQQPDGQSGQCAIRVLVDGKMLYEDQNARGDQKPIDVVVNVSGTSKLALEVDFGQGQDVGDRVVWANARLVRAGVQR